MTASTEHGFVNGFDTPVGAPPPPPIPPQHGMPRAHGMKFDNDKPRTELLMKGMPRALLEVAKVLTHGAEKYDAHNWKLVDRGEDRYWGAKSRHELLRASGEDFDTDSGLLHLAHEACNALFLLELELVKRAERDTPF